MCSCVSACFTSGLVGFPGLTCAVGGNYLGCFACRTERNSSSAHCGTGCRRRSPLSQSPPANNKQGALWTFASSRDHASLFTLRNGYHLDCWLGLRLIQDGQQLREVTPCFVALGVDDLSRHLKGNAAHFVPDVFLWIPDTQEISV